MPEAELIRVAVVGAAGRMGREALKALTRSEGFSVEVAVDRTSVGVNARDLVGPAGPDLVIEDKLGAALDRKPVDVMLDLSHHSAVSSHCDSAMKRGASPVIGCTGMAESELRELRMRCEETGVPGMYVPNFAVGAVLMMKFSELAAQWMPNAEIIELHHDRKEDAPSGTAMLTAEIIGEARREDPLRLPIPLMKADGARGGKVHDVPVHSVRLPGLLAHQQVLFGAPGEVLTIRHDSMDRASFMHGVKICCRNVKSLNGLVIGLDKILFR